MLHVALHFFWVETEFEFSFGFVSFEVVGFDQLQISTTEIYLCEDLEEQFSLKLCTKIKRFKKREETSGRASCNLQMPTSELIMPHWPWCLLCSTHSYDYRSRVYTSCLNLPQNVAKSRFPSQQQLNMLRWSLTEVIKGLLMRELCSSFRTFRTSSYLKSTSCTVHIVC